MPSKSSGLYQPIPNSIPPLNILKGELLLYLIPILSSSDDVLPLIPGVNSLPEYS